MIDLETLNPGIRRVVAWTGQVKNSGTHDVIVQAAKAGKGVRIITAISEAA